jgi:parvulin-like peptidyl-prolyl isomerase
MKVRAFVLAVCSLFLLSACGNLFDTAAAVVGGSKITIAEVTEGLEDFQKTEEYKRLAQQGDIELIKRQVQQAYLSDLIRRQVLQPEADERGIEVTQDEIDEQIDAIREDFGGEEEFQEGLAERNLDEARLEQIIHDRLLEEKLRAEVTSGAQPSEAEVEAYYEENVGDYTSVHSQHILVEEKALAQQIAEQLQSAPDKKVDALFEKLARENSTDKASAKDSGDLGFTNAGELVEEYESAAAELDIGEISDPVQSQFGYHVIRVLERRVTPLESVADSISAQIGEGAEEEAWQEWLRDAYEEADIRINSRYGELDLDTQQVVDATSEDIPGAEDTPTPSPSPTE